MFQFSTKYECVNDNCYVHMDAIVFSDPFWLMVSKGLLSCAFIRILSCLVLLWPVPVVCCLLDLNIASWCYSWHVAIFTKSVMMLSFALLPCLFEPAIEWISHSSVFIFCQASWVDHYHVFCCHVNLMLQRDPCIFLRCSVRMFCSYSGNWSIPAIVCNFRVP